MEMVNWISDYYQVLLCVLGALATAGILVKMFIINSGKNNLKQKSGSHSKNYQSGETLIINRDDGRDKK
ncbi:hypothetical protein [Saccharospirillum alexandrii]|uniref:hypothetical protein n=1 Tax=Saccharospirillum alexandrii TaxID=2448477 RepID=UPI000FDA35F7|nr:hypothetical protein [Saccharospirillum alexandrii]